MGAFLWDGIGTILFLLVAGGLVLRWLSACGVSMPRAFAEPVPKRLGEAVSRQALWRVFGAALLFRLLYALAGLFLYNALSGVSLGVLDIPALWSRWDAPHYIKLVELGYDGYRENGQPLFLVFFPLYVWIVRGVRLLISDTALAGMLVSFVCFGWGCTYLYRLTCEEYGSKIAKRALILLCAFPFSFFFGGIMTESLFLLTTTAGLYHIRRHQWGRAALWGVAAALTRMQGVILVGAAVAELCNEVRPFAVKGEERRHAVCAVLKKLPLLCVPVLGSVGYLILNWSVTGNPFAFTVMQEHWSQGFMWFPQVLRYLAKNAVGWYNVTTRWEMWIPELLLFVLFAILFWRSRNKHRSMFTLYGFVYFTLNYCLSWLLSAGRYLSCGVPFYLFGATELEGKPKLTAGVVVGMFTLQAFFLYRYFCWGQVM